MYLDVYICVSPISSNKNSRIVQVVMNLANVDVWKVDSTGMVDMMMDRKTARVALHYLHRHCSVLISNVETHVKSAEEDMLNHRQKMKVWPGLVSYRLAYIHEYNVLRLI